MKPEDRLEDIIHHLVSDDEVEFHDDTVLDEIPGWNSIVRINLMFALEQQLGIRFTKSEIFDFETVGQLQRFVRAHARSGAEYRSSAGR